MTQAEKAESFATLHVPGLIDPALIAALCTVVELPVNVMMMKGAPSIEVLATAGVARVSHGGPPHVLAMSDLAQRARELYGS